MHARRWLTAGALALCLGGAAVIWWRAEALPRARIDASREVRVAYASLGTMHVFSLEPAWKRALRKITPRAWQPGLGVGQVQTLGTLHESLVVWIKEVDSNGRVTTPAALQHAFAVLPDGNLAPATQRAWRDGTRLSFSSFARGSERVPLQLQFGGNVVELAVRNPRPVRRAQWSAGPLPQTNQVLDSTKVILREVGPVQYPGQSCNVRLKAVGADNVHAGWITWRVSAFDSWGNWSVDGSYASLMPRLTAPFPTNEPVWELRAYGIEYLSAGFVKVPQAGEHQVLLPRARAQQLGVQCVIWAGPGVYQISPSFEVVCKSSTPLLTRVQADHAGWNFQFAEPSALCITRNGAAQIRLRERTGSGGRIFRTKRITGSRPAARNVSAVGEIFTPELPVNPQNLEVEIVFNLPPADFFIRAPWRNDLKGGDPR